MFLRKYTTGFIILAFFIAVITATAATDLTSDISMMIEKNTTGEINLGNDIACIVTDNSHPFQREVREKKGNNEFIVNSSGHFVVIEDPHKGTAKILNLSFIKESRPGIAEMDAFIPYQDSWDQYLKTGNAAYSSVEISPVTADIQTRTINLPVQITQPGVYELTSDYFGNDSAPIEIRCSDVILIGNDHSIRGDNPQSFSRGILIIDGTSNVTILNVSISSWDYGIDLQGDDCIIANSIIYDNIFSGIFATGDRTNIQNNQIFYNVFNGIELFSKQDNYLTGNIISHNEFRGIEVFASDNNFIAGNLIYANDLISGIRLLSSNNNEVISNFIIGNNDYGIETDDSENVFINNFLDNTINLYISSSGKKNILNETIPIPGINIISGTLIGGNYWALPNNSGFSQATQDNDNNGISDLSYTLDSNNSDRYPLASGKIPTSLTLNTPVTAYCNKSFTLSGRLTQSDGGGIADALILINGDSLTITDNQGFYQMLYSPGVYRGLSNITASFPGWSGLKPSISTKTVNVLSQNNPLSISLYAPDKVGFGQNYTVSGYVTSMGVGVSATLTPEQSRDNSNWSPIFPYPYSTIYSDSSGYFSWKESITPPTSMYRYLRIRHSENCYYPSVMSPTKTIHIVPPVTTVASPSSVLLGETASDIATLLANDPTGSITFTLYDKCGGNAVFTSTVPVDGNGGYTSDPWTANAVGDFFWVASYHGDKNNQTFTTSCGEASEIVTVKQGKTITVVGPNGGETWKQGTVQTIKWAYTGNLGSTVKIQLLKRGVVNKMINASTSIGTNGIGSYSWKIPYNQALGSDYKIQIITDKGYNDTSKAAFTISAGVPITVTVPNSGEFWNRGTTQTIKWKFTGNPGPDVKIVLLKNGVVNRVITRSTLIGTNGIGSYKWCIPATQATGTDYKIRVVSTSDSTKKDVSNRVFTIRG